MEVTSDAISENMTHVLRICSWIPVTFGISLSLFSVVVFLEHAVIMKELLY